MVSCRICGASADTPLYKVAEMYFGTRETFTYQQCAQCSCLQIVTIPDNLGQYYPADYYSKLINKKHTPDKAPSNLRERKLNAALKNQRLISAMLFFLSKPGLPPWLSYVDVHSQSRILDVGCGAGKLLLKLAKKGFRHLEGVDPFISEALTYANGVRIYKSEMWDIAQHKDKSRAFDLVMMHHSLEHIPDQHGTFAAARELLNATGTLLIRIPLSCSWAWEHYRQNWVQLDAPRHLYLHSIKSMQVLAIKHGFELQSVHFDSTRFQFTGSERYLRDIALTEKEEEDVFSSQELGEYQRKAEALNREGKGDQACFIFKLDNAGGTSAQ
jgi:2-polyprenyl-3-methyl-5-hydroxy-6-metoxy-1,4-benzoquinol methylase